MAVWNFGMRCALALLAAVLLSAADGSVAADAGDKKSGRERELARRVQLLQQEKGELAAKLKDLGDKGEELNQAAERAKRDAARASRDLAAAKQEGAAVAAELAVKAEAFETEKKDLRRRLEETAARLALRENEQRRLAETAALQLESMGRQGKLIESCRSENAKLYDYGAELLQQFRREAAGSGYALIGLGGVEAFNAYQDYRDKLDRLRIEAPRPAQ
jgi:chromosome segregation ATPase